MQLMPKLRQPAIRPRSLACLGLGEPDGKCISEPLSLTEGHRRPSSGLLYRGWGGGKSLGLDQADFLAEFSYGKISGEFFLADIAQSLMNGIIQR